MHSSSTDVSRRYLHGVWNAMRQVEVIVTPTLAADIGVDLTHLLLLEYAAHTDLAPGEIATVMRLDAHTVSRALGRLERFGLLERSVDKEDARRRVLRATPLGRSALERFHARLTSALSPLFAQLGHDDLEGLLRTLTLLATAEPETALSGSGAARSAAHRGSERASP